LKLRRQVSQADFSSASPSFSILLPRRIFVRIAGLAVYLGSAESSGMTGQSIHIDGGMVLS